MKRTVLLSRWRWLLAVVATLALAPQVARAIDGSQEVAGGGSIDFTGAAKTNWVANASGGKDLLIYFTAENAETDPSPATFKFPGTTKAKILAIGGGGGGGGSYSLGYSGNYGGGGGGGAGGFIETNALFSAATYNVSVGAGGAGGARASSHKAPVSYAGENGEKTSIYIKAPGDFLTAVGGGGGGGETPGGDGGSGGGGSMLQIGPVKNPGGVQSDEAKKAGNHGNAGGAGNVGMWGGGGGGASGAGADADGVHDPVGGEGRQSDITVASGTAQTSWPYYAGGGGGAHTDKSIKTATSGIAGGQGGGGKGGVGQGANAFKPTAGEPGTGGGGGAGNCTVGGAAGGSGVVIVRIEAALNGPLDKDYYKSLPNRFKHTGSPFSFIAEAPFYTLKNNTATDVGTYITTMKPVGDIKWTDGTSDELALIWTIYDENDFDGEAMITGAPVKFYGVTETNWVKNAEGGYDLLLKFTGAGSYELPGSTVARILAIGGGGGGGGSYSLGYSGNYGGGGGGGAGGFIETNALFSAATYNVSVGAGGAGGARASSHKAPVSYAGANGKDTAILANGLSFLTAIGGGGGGGECVGGDGGSGGGGSMLQTGAVKNLGGVQSDEAKKAGNLGNAGGAGNVGMWGGGGGGAGGAGGDADGVHDPVGGKGRQSDITLNYGVVQENWPYFAGGGGGAHTDKGIKTATEGIAGGKGGGGQGGVGQGANAFKPTAGEPGTGGGGGAGNCTVGGAAGGSGVVYVRISATMRGEFKKPVSPDPIPYDGNAHTSVVSTVFYEVTDANIGTNAGTYVAHATLKGDYEWPEGGKEPAEITMVITKVDVTISGLKQKNWEFGTPEEKIPAPEFTVSPEWVKSRVVCEYAKSKDAPEEEWDAEKPSDAGHYWVRARLPDQENFNCKTQYAEFDITRVHVTFTDLKLRSWLRGTPPESVPKPTCTVDPSWVLPIYSWAKTKDAPEEEWILWSDEKPTEAGPYWLRVKAASTDDYDYETKYAEFKIVEGLGDVFTDYVEITIGAYTGTNPSELTNFPYRVTLSETFPVGFLYERAKNANDLAFTDEEGRNVLYYQVGAWNPNGESTLYVRIPLIASSKQVIRLYWRVRDDTEVPDHHPELVWSDWTDEDYRKITNPPEQSFESPVVREGYCVNYWAVEPKLTKNFWDVTDAEVGKIERDAKPRFGTCKRTFTNIVEQVGYDEMPTDIPGSFRVVYTLVDPDEQYLPLECYADYAVTKSTPWTDLKGAADSLTLSGRVLLANDDAVDEAHRVTDQGYWQTREVVTNKTTGATLTNSVYWTHEGETTRYTTYGPHLLTNSIHRLNYVDADENVHLIWRLENVRLGNSFYDSTSYNNRCFLPWSSTGLGITSYDKRNVKGERNEVGWLVMRNMGEENDARKCPVIYSPCYTNGIGTIYFDAVNGMVNRKVNNIPQQEYRIVVEVATATDDGLPPTDENAYGFNPETGNVEELGRISAARWQKWEMTPFLRNGAGAKLERVEPTKDLSLNVETANSVEYFYRICVKVNYRRPVRFRIRRVSCVPDTLYAMDNNAFVLLDNLIVSYPQMTADLAPYGQYDQEKSGKLILGWGGAMDTPFPAAGESDVKARVQLTPYVNGFTNIVPESVALRTQMFYRWRYLDQAYVPENPDEWSIIDLWPDSCGMKSKESLKLPDAEGDLEFWFRTDLNVPYYKYFDYSGLDLGLKGADGKDVYTEEQRKVDHRLDPNDYDPLPSAGTNWFVRLRAGRSDYEQVNVLTRRGLDGDIVTNEMELVGNGLWRACVQTWESAPDGLYYRFEGINRQKTGATEYATGIERWTADAEIKALPADMSVVACGPDGWAKTLCDAKTGYLMFRLDEAKESVYVARGDYQDFNLWSSGVNTNGLFVGNRVDTNSTSYVAQEIPVNWAEWPLSSATNSKWREDFDVGTSRVARVIYPRNEPFAEKTSERGWTVENAMWTYGKWSIESKEGYGDATAAQLEGRGRGRMSFIDGIDIPQGLDSVIMTARVAQFNEFENFSYFNGYVLLKDPPTSVNDFVHATSMSNATFATLAALTETGAESYQGDGSLSLVANYHPQNGGYELRVSRATSEGSLRLALYRWRINEGAMTCELLDKVADYNASSTLTSDMLVKDWKGLTSGKIGGLYISVGRSNDGKGVIVKGGVCRDSGLTSSGSKGSTMSGKSFISIAYNDTSALRIKNGTFGVLARNCPGVFVNPVYYPTSVSFGTVAADKITADTSAQTVNFQGTAVSGATDDGYYNNWIIKKERSEKISGHPDCWGFQAIKGIKQDVWLQVSDHGSGKWETIATNTVVGFNNTTFSNVVRNARECDVRLQVAGTVSDVRKDVVVSAVELTQWIGDTTPGIDTNYGLTNSWVYTSAWVLPGEADPTNKTILLQPTRAATTATAVSLRTPIMRGFGLIHFDWRNADPNAVLHVQVAPNATRANLLTLTRAASDYSQWETLETLKFSECGASGSHTVYVNRRFPASGALRLVIDRGVVETAITGGTSRQNAAYGQVEITRAFVWDLPEYDARSWTGWNFRVDGWDGTNPGEWANLTDGTHGRSGLLNNTLDKATLADEITDNYKDRPPSVQTPTFGTNSVGALDFRARLYGRDDLATHGYPAVVTVYGARKKDIFGEPSDWTEVCEFAVSNGFYRTFSKRFRPSDNFFALRLGVKGVAGVVGGESPTYDPPLRVALDDICVYERPKLALAFRNLHARPFRNAESIKGRSRVRDIATVNEQPLLGEAFGFQAEIEVKSDDEILVGDPTHPIEVELWYYPKAEPWGFRNWSTAPGAVCVPLSTAEGEHLVFRSMTSNPDSLCPPQVLEKGETYGIVQYQFVAHYYDTSLEHYDHEMSSEDWTMAPWNEGFEDPNAKDGADFSGFTLLEAIAPKRAWLNEINYVEADATTSKKNQWIEIAVPSGVDMTGWHINVYKLSEGFVGELFRFGAQGSPSSKQKSGDPSHYDFYVVQSPESELGSDIADARWLALTAKTDTSIEEGRLSYTNPFGFELVRPTGVVEHRVVTQGWNQYWEAGYWYAWMYDGTNLVKELNEKTNGDWTWSCEDFHASRFCTLGVVTNQGALHAEWVSPMTRTPAAKNVGQYIDPDWFVNPNGGYYWIYSTVLGEHMRQIIAGETNLVASITLMEGDSTNIVYEVDRWYQLGEVKVTPQTGKLTGPEKRDGKSYYTLSLENVSNRLDITATDEISDELRAAGLGPDNRYTPAIMKWLEKGVHGGPDGTDVPFKGDSITTLNFRNMYGLLQGTIDLTGIYWFDLDPTDPDWEVWGDILIPDPPAIIREREFPGGSLLKHTNHVVTARMMITNVVPGGVAYAPYRLQGYGNERSDSYPGVWTSVNFQVTMQLLDGVSSNRTMSSFVFDHGSFHGAAGGPDGELPFSANIEIVDPFSRQSPAWEWDWWKYSDKIPGKSWRLNSNVSPAGVEMLKKNNYLEF